MAATMLGAGGEPAGLALAQGALWTYLPRMGGLMLSCGEGTVWLTREGDTEDHVLQPGDALQMEGHGRVVVQALRPARLYFAPTPPSESARTWEGLLLGALGVVAFSFTLPATRVAVPELGGTVVGLGRALIAAVLAGLLLAIRRERLPERRHWPRLALVAGGVVVGFPLLSALALRHMPASHGAVLVGLLPAATAVAAVFRARERPSWGFWLSALAGLGCVVGFALAQATGRPTLGNALMLLAVAAAAVGYAEGGALARELGSWRVICWALVLSAPFLAPVVALSVRPEMLSASPRAWLGMGYVSVVSMFLGFFAWYRGLALGGVARVSQLQLVQPLLTLLWCALLLGEPVGRGTFGVSVLVMLCVLASVRGRVRRAG
ncbi:EamA family transporter [Archangium violaceum]|uniref:EamA family transporter n=1 Tax=Archangium violaceum TaxID=83451 RepID=UPI0019524A24|nr:EamA family transporter [Archangium violaceum]QRN98232.1 EamA family transporter [Archangium violaceum]